MTAELTIISIVSAAEPQGTLTIGIIINASVTIVTLREVTGAFIATKNTEII